MDESFYCDDCCEWHETVDDCPETLYDCPVCLAEYSVQVLRGPVPDEPAEAHCEVCGWTEEVW